MGPPEGGRTKITARIMRHFNLIGYTELDDQTIKQIFSTLANNFLKKLPEMVRFLLPNVIDSVIQIYQ